ncbi:hypothetical protein B9Z19DRAFT_1134466 [Tuber borchii]|uniref:Rhodanese domain-containing protein n=1 Tax=Tuber borchii TaxID=42251 RepID=A0A2T6ZE63_TUBBO|nr:hypothetical protein B9Z19DRAFT_1134466 [Tuber borchii]
MSSVTVASLNRISCERLRTLLLTQHTQPGEEKVVVVDVPSRLNKQDPDHIGGHIKSSRHVPSGSLDYTAAELARQLKGAEKVVFHCLLSQQRGPSAALRYQMERERLFGRGSTVTAGGTKEEEGGEGREGGEEGEVKMQEVLVLDGGFAGWQAKYGNDERLTENYNKELWEAEY